MSPCSLRLQADSAPVKVLHQCGLFRTPHGLGACWAQQNAEGDVWSVVQGFFSCVGHAAFHVVTHDLHDSLHSARVMVLPDTGSSYVLEGAGSGRWSLWHPCATEIDWASTSQLGRELPHSCNMQLSQFSEVQVTAARGTVTITAQSEVQYASLVPLLLSLYLILEAEALSHTRCIRLAWGCLGPFVCVLRLGNFISRVSRTVTGADGAGEAGVNCADLSGALLFGTLTVIGTWAIDFMTPPQFPPPLFVHPLGLSVRGGLVCGALLISTVAFGLIHGFQQADDAIARVRGSLVQSIRFVAVLIAAICVADAGVTASLLGSTTLLLIWAISVAWTAMRRTLVACYHKCWRRRRGRHAGGGVDGHASAAELDSDDDEPPSPDGAAGAAKSFPRFSRDFVCANYDPSQDFHARGAELAAAEVAKLMASEEFQERFHGDRLHPSRPVGFLEVCMIS